MPHRPEPIKDEQQILAPDETARASFGQAFERIVGLMARLRAKDGCPWDREQSLETLRPYLIEEAYEVLEAVDTGSVEAHKEELGDLLLQVVFHAEIRREEGVFDAADVAHGIADKLVRRHPHVFGDNKAADAGQAYERWEEMKSKEKKGRSIIAGVPKQMPALLRAQRVGEKASSVGFDWNRVEGPLEKVDEEIAELKTAVAKKDKAAIEHELGDALFSLVNVARFLDVTAEDSLRATIERFSKRFTHVENSVRSQDKAMSECSMDELEVLWEQAKKQE